MKTIKIVLSVVALVMGLAGAVTSKALQDITNRGVEENQPSTSAQPTVEFNKCDNEETEGFQCKLDIEGQPLAYRVSDSSEPLMRPN